MAASGVSLYQIQRAVGSGAPSLLKDDVSGTSYSDTAVTVGTTYTYSVYSKSSTTKMLSVSSSNATVTNSKKGENPPSGRDTHVYGLHGLGQ